MESDAGFYNNVASFDFNSLYPSVMIAYNICWSTLLSEFEKNDPTIPKNILPNGTAFRIDKRGLMPEAVEYLLNKRKEIKAQLKDETDEKIRQSLDVRQKSVKILANSFFGVCGLWGSRLYSNEIGNAITSFGRFALPYGQEYFNARERKIVVQDTDSMYVVMKDMDLDKIENIKDDFVDNLRKFIKENHNTYRPEVFKMGFEKLYKTLLVIKKKMYAGKVIIEDGKKLEIPKIVIKGLKLIKSDTTIWAGEIAKQLLDDVLDLKYTSDHYIRFLKQERQNLISGKIPIEKLKISRRLGKEIDDYDSDNLVYVNIANRMKNKGYSITSHQTINFYITDGNTPMKGVSEEEALEEGKVELDMVYYWNNGLLKIILPILETVFPEIDWNELKFPRKIGKNPFQIKYTYYLG